MVPTPGMRLNVVWSDSRLDMSKFSTVEVMEVEHPFLKVRSGECIGWVPLAAMREVYEAVSPSSHPELAPFLLQTKRLVPGYEDLVEGPCFTVGA